MKKGIAFLVCILFLVASMYTLPVMALPQQPTVAPLSFGNGVVYYVDSVFGDDEASGKSADEPWKSLIKVNSFSFSPGDTVLLKCGSVFLNQHLYIKGSGEQGNPLTVSSYGEGEKPQIIACNTTGTDGYEALPNDSALYLKNPNYVIVDGLYFQNATPSTGEQSAAFIGWSGKSGQPRIEGSHIQNCTFFGSSTENWSTTENSKLSGISVGAYIQSITIENNEIYNFKGNGITIDGYAAGCNYNGVPNALSATNVVVRGNYMYNIGCDGILVNNCNQPLVEYNTVNMSHNYSKAAEAGIWPFACYGALIQYNEAMNTKTTYDGQGFDCDYLCYNTCVQYNYSHNNTGGFMLICTESKADWMPNDYAYNRNSVIRYNISENDSHYTFTLCGGIENTKVYNNTIYTRWGLDTAGKIIFALEKGKNIMNGYNYPNDISFENNLIYTNNFNAFDWKGCTNVAWKNNLFYSSSQRAPSNGTVSNSEDNGKYVCSACGEKSLLTDYTVLDEANSTYNCPKCLQECTVSAAAVCNFTSSGNIYSKDPLMINPGYAGNGAENCNGYKLYSNSPCIGAGKAIDETSMLYKSTDDFFDNPIAAVPNIGAYQGSGEGENTVSLKDGRYKMLVDFETASASAKGANIANVLSGNSWASSIAVTSEYISDNYGSTKAVIVDNTGSSSGTANWSYFVGYGALNAANGISFWISGCGVQANGYILINGYKCSFSIPADGGVVNLRWNKTSWRLNTTGAVSNVDCSTFASASVVEIGVTNLGVNDFCAIDNIAADMMEDAQIPTTTPQPTSAYEDGDGKVRLYSMDSGSRPSTYSIKYRSGYISFVDSGETDKGEVMKVMRTGSYGAIQDQSFYFNLPSNAYTAYGTPLSVSFQAKCDTSWVSWSKNVYFSSTGTNTSNTFPSILKDGATWDGGSFGSEWATYTIDLTSGAGLAAVQNGYLYLNFKNKGGSANYFYIDNVVLNFESDSTPSVNTQFGQSQLKFHTQMCKGASMRYPTAESTVDGIRFLSRYKTSDIEAAQALGYEITEYGTDIYYETDPENIKTVYASGFYRELDGYSYVAGSIIGIKQNHIAGEFTGSGFITMKNSSTGDTVKIYAVTNDNTRAIAYIAHCIKQSDEYGLISSAAKVRVDDYSNYYVEK